MDPAIANKDFDPPAPPSMLRRGLMPALLVNALFVIALGWSVPWSRSTSPGVASLPSSDLGAMGGPPTVVATAPVEAPAPVQRQQSIQQTPQAVAVPEPGSTFPAAPPVRPAPQRAPVVAAMTAPARTATPVKPSFDCAKARSRSEKLICADPELAQLDRDLGRMNIRARLLSPDPAAFRRAGDAEWKRREAECRDKACLLTWYAHRRDQLQQAIDRGEKTAGR